MNTEDPTQRQQKRMTVYQSQKIILFVSLLLVSSFFKSRDEIPFKGVDLSHPEISNFRM
jgi:hypothetical protein